MTRCCVSICHVRLTVLSSSSRQLLYPKPVFLPPPAPESLTLPCKAFRPSAASWHGVTTRCLGYHSRCRKRAPIFSGERMSKACKPDSETLHQQPTHQASRSGVPRGLLPPRQKTTNSSHGCYHHRRCTRDRDGCLLIWMPGSCEIPRRRRSRAMSSNP